MVVRRSAALLSVTTATAGAVAAGDDVVADVSLGDGDVVVVDLEHPASTSVPAARAAAMGFQ
ncbi:MAG: hypothetical protein NVS1B16_15530 [Pseudarthrobacter sp.]